MPWLGVSAWWEYKNGVWGGGFGGLGFCECGWKERERLGCNHGFGKDVSGLVERGKLEEDGVLM